MTTASPPDLLRDALDHLGKQEKRIEALESLLFQLAPLTVHAKDLPAPPPPDTVAVASDETRPSPRRQTPTTIPVPIPRERQPERGVSPAQVVASLDDVVWSLAPDGEVVFLVAGAVERTFGRDANSLRSIPGAWLDTLPPDDRHAFRAALNQATATDLVNLEHRALTPGGAVRWLHSRGRLVRDADGRPLRIDGVSTDITARVRTRRGVFAILEGVGATTGPAFLDALVRHVANALEARAVLVAVPDDPHHARTMAVHLDGRLAANFEFPTTGGLMEDVFAGGARFIPADARDRFPTDTLLAQLRAESVVAEPLIDDTGAFLGTLVVIDDRPVRSASPDVRAVLKALAPRAAVEVAPTVRRTDLNTAVRTVAPVLCRVAGSRVVIDLAPVLPSLRADAAAVTTFLLHLIATLPDAGPVTVRTATVTEGVALTVTHAGERSDKSRVVELGREAGGVVVIVASPEWGTTVRVAWTAASLRVV